MIHDISFYEFDRVTKGHSVVLTRQEVIDITDTLFIALRSKFIFNGWFCENDRTVKKTTVAYHVFDDLSRTHNIYFEPGRILNAFNLKFPAGGNVFYDDLRVYTGMILAHELQHANQTIHHDHSHTSFYGKKNSKYRARACEREARMFATENISTIEGILGIEKKITMKQIDPGKAELLSVVESLLEYDVGELSMEDVREELKMSGMNNSKNVVYIRDFLEKQAGIKLP